MLLWPLSQVYRFLWEIRLWLYRHKLLRKDRLPVPVIVVGNVVVGGAGKTPTVLALLNHLKARGWTPGVVSRGHGRRGADTREVFADTPADVGGDEPCLIRRVGEVPVFVARQRARAARALLAAHPDVDVLVCDDGLQHFALARDISVAVFDDRGTGNGWLLPAGMLREPWPPKPTRFGPADLVLRQRRTTADDPEPLPMPAGMPMFWAQRCLADEALGPLGERRALGAWSDQPLVALAGIARPEVFFDMLRERGLNLAQTLALPDHAGAERYRAALQQVAGTLLCTEKDAVKLFACLSDHRIPPPPSCWAVPLQLHPEPAFFEALDLRLATLEKLSSGRLSSKHGHQTA